MAYISTVLSGNVPSLHCPVVIPAAGPNTVSPGGDLVSTWVANPFVHAEVQITS